MQPMIECVPNFSEGRRPEVVAAIVESMTAVEGVTLLDREMDPSHNRCVVTFVAPPGVVVEAALRGMRKAAELIDLNHHEGEHPRMGATDVVPFVPLGTATMDQCVELAKELGRRAGEELGIPVFLYEAAATRPQRENLAEVRKGEFEGLREAIGRDPARLPDFGPGKIHPTAGATAVGARMPLVAFNVNLGTPDVRVAKEVAKALRFQTGGLRYVKALGFFLEDRGIAQVSMNLVNYRQSPMHRAFAMVREEAERFGVGVVGSEIVGLVPQDALFAAAEHALRLEAFTPNQVLENKLAAAGAGGGGGSVGEFLDRIASREPTPGGGAVSAHAGALAAALGAMVAGLTVGRKKYAAVDAEMRQAMRRCEELRSRLSQLVEADNASFDEVMRVRKTPANNEIETSRKAKLELEALWKATRVPLETARAAAEVVGLAGEMAAKGNRNALSDAGVGLLMSQAAGRGALYNVAINLKDLPDGPDKEEVRREAAALKQALAGADSVLAALEAGLA
ncbi:MAG: glutamate formimidoyltransferase [Candidatus Eisenbacteria bacterium]|nr:glutamate formimidoyltransferase [Candidatus Eisenbacteria bacterium]